MNEELLTLSIIKKRTDNLCKAFYKRDFKSLIKFFKRKFSIDFEISYHNGIDSSKYKYVYGTLKVIREYGILGGKYKKCIKTFHFREVYTHQVTFNDTQSFVRQMLINNALSWLIKEFTKNNIKRDIIITMNDIISQFNLNDDMVKRIKIIADDEYIKKCK